MCLCMFAVVISGTTETISKINDDKMIVIVSALSRATLFLVPLPPSKRIHKKIHSKSTMLTIQSRLDT